MSKVLIRVDCYPDLTHYFPPIYDYHKDIFWRLGTLELFSTKLPELLLNSIRYLKMRLQRFAEILHSFEEIFPNLAQLKSMISQICVPAGSPDD